MADNDSPKPGGDDSFGDFGNLDGLSDDDMAAGMLKKRKTIKFRPTLRPPMALLRVLDDGRDTGETLRIRKSPFVIGRMDGDCVIPHDDQVSSKHAQIYTRKVDDQFQWFLKDLDSTNGTFVRATSIVLKPNQVMLIGAQVFHSRNLDAVEQGTGSTMALDRQWQYVFHKGMNELVPQLREIRDFTSTSMEGKLGAEERGGYYIGSDFDACDLVLDDPTVSRKHARVYRDEKGRWRIEDLNSTNGVWLKVTEACMRQSADFQCGEQRFRFEVL